MLAVGIRQLLVINQQAITLSQLIMVRLTMIMALLSRKIHLPVLATLLIFLMTIYHFN